MQKLLLTFLFLGMYCYAFSQQDIYEALGVEKTDCNASQIPSKEMNPPNSGFTFEDPPSLPKPKFNTVDTLGEKLKKQFQNTSKYYSPQIKSNLTLPINNGDILFLENELWGVKNKKGRILLTPQFDFVTTDTFQNGFVGYQSERCNYYVRKRRKYKKVLATDYFHIEAFKDKKFIVQSETGYGIVNSKNSIILPLDNLRIRRMWFKGLGIFDVWDENDERYVFVEKEGLKFYPRGYGFTMGFHVNSYNENHLTFSSIIFNLKTNEQFFCHPEFSTSLVSKEHQLVFVQKIDSEEKGYLCDFSGKLISKNGFTRFKDFNEFDQATVAIEEKVNGRKQTLFGVINEKGEWIIPAKFSKIDFKFGYYHAIEGSNSKTATHGVFDENGKIIIPFESFPLSIINEKLVVQLKKIDDKTITNIIQIPDNKILHKDLPYQYFISTKLCEDQVFLAALNREYSILDKNFHPINEEKFNNVSYGNGDITAEDKTDRKKIKFKRYTCGGKLIEVNVNGEMISTYQKFIPISDELSFIKLLNGECYFLLNDITIHLQNPFWKSAGNIYRIFPANHKDFYIVPGSNGTAIVNLEGELVSPIIFSGIGSFNDEYDLAQFTMGKKKGYIKRDGSFLFGQNYDEIEHLGLDYFKVKKDKLIGVVNRKDEIIVPLQKLHLWKDGGLITVSKNNNAVASFTSKGNKISKKTNSK